MPIFEGVPRDNGAILIDAPTRFATWSPKGMGRSPERHYRTMSFEQLGLLPIADLAARDCVLFLWVCWPTLLHSLALIDRWGFIYKTCAFNWTKVRDGVPSIGPGYWTRSNSESCLLATRGKPWRKHRDVRQAIIEPRREHSRKPDCVHERIERLVDGPYLELFARRRRFGWHCWGDEIEKFREAAE